MKFSKLRLLGFKSFVDATDFSIEPGLTGVVGPNGCGKSNLVEALRWVMGENSYKSMRGSGMDDVIFSGSLHRPSRNTAEVSVILDNQARTAPVAFNGEETIEVTRRIERESGSLYRINGKEVRAKDVALLFADASTGAHSRALVRQGQISELISAKPKDRRQVLEEAAGISGLHSRRHEAELRLRASEQNMARLEDVLAQLDSQLDSLKRQARQAKRYKLIGADIRKAEATLFHLRWIAAGRAVTEAEAQLTGTSGQLAEAQAEQTAAAKDQAISAHKLPQFRDQETQLAAAAQRLKMAEADLLKEEQRIADRMAELGNRIEQLQQDMTREQQLVSDNAALLNRLEEERQELEQTEAASKDAGALAIAAVQDTQARVAAEEEKLAALTAQAADRLARRRQLEQSVMQLAQKQDQLRAQIQRTDSRLAELSGTSAPQNDAGRLRDELANCDRRSAELEQQIATLESQSDHKRSELEQARTQLAEARTAYERLSAEAATLQRIIDASRVGDSASVLEDMSVHTGYEVALGAALGDDLDASIDPNSPMFWGDCTDSSNDPALPAGVPALTQFVSADRRLSRRLNQIGVIEDTDGPRLQLLLQPGQRLVSKSGALWRWDGFTASADAPTAAAQRLARDNRLVEVNREVATAAEILANTETTQSAATTQADQARRQLKEMQQQRRVVQNEISTKRQQLDQIERKLAEHNREAAALAEAKNQLGLSLSTNQTEHQQALNQLGQLEDTATDQQQIDQLNAVLGPLREELAVKQAQQQGLSQAAASRQARLQAIADELQQWQARVASAKGQQSVLQERITSTSDERSELAKLPEQILQQKSKLAGQVADARQQLEAAQAARVSAEEQSRSTDQRAQAALNALQSAKEQHIRAEERLHAARERLSDVEIRIEDELEMRPHMVFAAAGLSDDKPLPEEAAVEARHERLKSERDRLGAVNLRAEDEATELTEKRDNLVAERDELIEAIKTLRQGIQNLNREGRERLIAAFDVVNEHFQNLFTHLFGGGAAELQLVESDDPLEAGLEILARPPGKKPQTMTLLSGGEQTLTATALIFAVFLTNPAPICVLDEVDAPLDDANVERYCSLLHEMARRTDTRFLVITHNPITMAEMDRLFGVTMAERGVSQLVSVDLQTAEQYRETA